MGSLAGVVPWGRLCNLRRRYFSGDLVVEVDRSDFPEGRVEWEVELENATDHPEAVQQLIDLMDRWGVRHEPQTSTKSARLARYCLPFAQDAP